MTLYEMRLDIDGTPTPVTADYTLRWVEMPGHVAEPVLYYQGKRITKSWSISMTADRPEDPHGGNANTN